MNNHALILAFWPLWVALLITLAICAVEAWPDFIRWTRRLAHRNRYTDPTTKRDYLVGEIIYRLPWV